MELENPDLLFAPPSTWDDFSNARDNCKPSVSPNDLKRYEDWTELYGIEG